MTPSFVCGAVTPDPGGAESELLNAFAAVSTSPRSRRTSRRSRGGADEARRGVEDNHFHWRFRCCYESGRAARTRVSLKL
jgi:hypothetical protein